MDEDKDQISRKIEQGGAGNQDMEKGLDKTMEKMGPDSGREARIESFPSRPQKETSAEEIANNKEGELGMGRTVFGSDEDKKSKEREKAIEKILEKNLDSIYFSLTPDKQRDLKISGEQTAEKINIILRKAKFKAGQIIDLIKKWLSLIPGVNRFFLEQEAKIKADEIIKLNNHG